MGKFDVTRIDGARVGYQFARTRAGRRTLWGRRPHQCRACGQDVVTYSGVTFEVEGEEEAVGGWAHWDATRVHLAH